MKTDLKSFYELYQAVCENDLVFMFGTGISASLSGENFGWYKWIADGIAGLKDRTIAASLQAELDSDSSAHNLIKLYEYNKSWRALANFWRVESG